VVRNLLVGILLCGCTSSSSDGYAVDLTVIADSTVDVAQISTLNLEVTGAETFSAKSISAAGKFKNGRAGIRYKPGVPSGKLTFALTAFNAGGSEIASGGVADVALKPSGTTTATITLSSLVPDDAGLDLAANADLSSSSSDLATCGNGVLDPGEKCDPTRATPCPSDCDDNNPCTVDSLTGSGCLTECTHTSIADNSACTPPGGDGGLTGVCLGGSCCTGCVSNGVCKPGSSDATVCGRLGGDCFDCTKNSASATCNSGTCSGCDATSCTNESRTCGTSSCGFNCGTCLDSCASGSITHYACVNKSCQQNGGGNCGLYASCKDGHTCKTDANGGCSGDGDCTSSAYCSTTCKTKVGLGSSCSAETSGDHECQSPYVCTWTSSGSGVCAYMHCSGCAAINGSYNACSGYINYGIDPRGACPYQNVCHQNFCAGLTYDNSTGAARSPSCDYGADGNGIVRWCGGSHTCSNVLVSGNNAGTRGAGNFCINGTCQAASSSNCSWAQGGPDQLFCVPCNGAGTDCDTSGAFFCN
jgi:hypothetical protein